MAFEGPPANDRHPEPETRPFRLEFSISESSESTEERPILYFERNGFVFKVELYLFANTFDIKLDVKRPESFNSDAEVLRTEVQAIAEEELQTRREKYSGYFE